MNQLDISFEPAPWERALERLPRGGTLPAGQLLAMLEDAEEGAGEEAFELLDQRDILLDLSDLPLPAGTGEAAVRLRWETQLVREGRLPQGLEEGDPLRLYLEELAGMPACGDPQLLAEACLAGDADAPGRLAGLMLSRVVELAYAHVGRGVLLLDLIQEGSLGLWQGILEYSGGDVEEYCARRIRRTMARLVTAQARASGVGQRMRQAMEDYRAVDQRLLSDLGRNPTQEEIALELHMTPEEAAAVADTMKAARMLAEARPAREPEEPDPEDEQAVEDTAYFQTRQRIAELLASLGEQDAKLLTLRFGLEGGRPLSPEEAGRCLGLTPGEVVERETAALAKLRSKG